MAGLVPIEERQSSSSGTGHCRLYLDCHKQCTYLIILETRYMHNGSKEPLDVYQIYHVTSGTLAGSILPRVSSSTHIVRWRASIHTHILLLVNFLNSKTRSRFIACHWRGMDRPLEDVILERQRRGNRGGRGRRQNNWPRDDARKVLPPHSSPRLQFSRTWRYCSYGRMRYSRNSA